MFKIEPAATAGVIRDVGLGIGGGVARPLLELNTKRRHTVARCTDDIPFAANTILLDMAQELAQQH